MAKTDAWLLSFGDAAQPAQAVVGIREVIQLIDPHDSYAVPQCHAICRSVKVWQEHVLPIADLSVLDCGANRATSADDILAVVAYPGGDATATRLGALRLHAPPQRIQVDDDDAIPPPASLTAWTPVMLACFTRGQQPIPILDVPALFGRAKHALRSHA